MSDEKTEESKDFKVVDHRRFNPDGSEKPSETTTEAPKKFEPETIHEAEKNEDFNQTSDEGISFANLILSLAGSAQMSLGVSPNPFTQKIEKDLKQAKQTIDLLGMLAEKTKGNLSEEEDKLLQVILSDLRLRFVEESAKK